MYPCGKIFWAIFDFAQLHRHCPRKPKTWSVMTIFRQPTPIALFPVCRPPSGIAESALRRELGSCVELEGLFVTLDRVALRFPARQSTLEEFDPQEMHG